MYLRSGTLVKKPTANQEVLHWYDLVDVYSTDADEAQFDSEYTDFLAVLLGASKVEVHGFVPARDGLKGVRLRALANGGIMMKRLGARLKGWQLLWKVDFEDQWM